MHVALQDLGEHQEQSLFEVADGAGVGAAGDTHRQTDRLKQVMVEVRFAGILWREGNETNPISRLLSVRLLEVTSINIPHDISETHCNYVLCESGVEFWNMAGQDSPY